MHRIHRTGRHAWWFSSDGSGRFDPIGTGTGACYLAERPLGAWIEVFRKRMLLSRAELDQRSLCSVALGRDLRLADLTSRRALEFGVTASVGASEDYATSQAFAVHAVGAGFDGVRYLLRHDPAQRLYGVALFAEAGGADWPTNDNDIPTELVAEATSAFGYRVLPTP